MSKLAAGFFRHNGQFPLLSLTKNCQCTGHTNTGISQQAMQIIDSGDGPSIERDYDVGFTQACASRRATLGGGQNYYPGLLGKIIEANQPPMKRHGLGLNPDVAAANFAMLQQASGDKFRGIDADCEAQALSAHNGRSVHSDYASVRTDQWSTGIARVQRGIGLNDVVDHAS